jgi:4-hydroxy-3-methylbut-2-enyl diphosphate reductase
VSALKVKNPDQLAFVTQTTLSVDDTKDVIDALRARFPNIVGPDTKDICYATQNRQKAVRELAQEVDLILVIGAPNSSNSNRLKEIAEELGVSSYLIENADQLKPEWLTGKAAIGVTAGASAPDVLVQDVVEKLRQMHGIKLEMMNGVAENVRFRLPPELIEGDERPAAAVTQSAGAAQ